MDNDVDAVEMPLQTLPSPQTLPPRCGEEEGQLRELLRGPLIAQCLCQTGTKMGEDVLAVLLGGVHVKEIVTRVNRVLSPSMVFQPRLVIMGLFQSLAALHGLTSGGRKALEPWAPIFILVGQQLGGVFRLFMRLLLVLMEEFK